MMGQPDEPENYHTLVYTLTATGSADDQVTHLDLTQDGNESEEQAEQFSQTLAGACSTASRPRSKADHHRWLGSSLCARLETWWPEPGRDSAHSLRGLETACCATS